MSRSSSARAAHLHAESAALESAQLRLASLRSARAEADRHLRIAQQQADDLATQQFQLEDRVLLMQESVYAARAAYMQEFLDFCPDDLLRCIFEAAFDLPDENWQSFGSGDYYNPARAALPFTLATVCSRWRRVALGFPKLWTYIGIPNPPCPQRVEVLLERSAPCTLEILFGDALAVYEALFGADPLALCMTALARESHRWRKVDIWLPKQASARFFDVFRGPLPVLEQLSLAADPVHQETRPHPRDTYLPFAPRLRQLNVAYKGFELTEHHPGFPSLVELACFYTCPTSTTMRLLSTSQATLQHLEMDSSEPVPVFPLVMPDLRSLCLLGTAFFTRWPQPSLQAPRLTTLSLYYIPINERLVPFLEHVAPTVTYLELFGRLDHTVLETVKHLTNVVHLAFGRPPHDSTRISDNLFAPLADAVPCIWPKLASLRIQASVHIDPSNYEGIVRLVYNRTGGRTEQMAALREVVLDHPYAPAWLVSEVERWLAHSQ